MAQKEKGALVKQAKAVTKDMVYENAYIVSNDDGRLIFICDGELYRAKGTMEENFTGVCDIEISGSKVKKIQIKPDDISGVMLSYGDGTMQIAGQGDIPMQSSELPVYDETGTSPKEIAVSDLIIGSETLSYILDSGRICAIVRRQAPDLTYIRVLIKNPMERMHFQQLQQVQRLTFMWMMPTVAAMLLMMWEHIWQMHRKVR